MEPGCPSSSSANACIAVLPSTDGRRSVGLYIDGMREGGTPGPAGRAAGSEPNAPSSGSRWGLESIGQQVNGASSKPGADVSAPAAWDLTTGSPSVVVAELDSGVDYTHPDLAANVWTNPGGVGGCAAGTRGYDVLTGTCDPMDDFGHGTHVAGILGAVGNNGIGVSGLDQSTPSLP